ncbi:hypothetical protein V6N12_023550 [Hibiscus sabdariffa]|uniref:RNase H type-1 domain-containing protein n=1 Tax=Hibiscus sabdariffa TaxID=183260 RepID=A0ABR2FY01_9ROSI
MKELHILSKLMTLNRYPPRILQEERTIQRVEKCTCVLDLIDKAWEVQVCRIPRRINRAADGMAKVARFDSLECDGFEVPPPVIVDLLRLDALEA